MRAGFALFPRLASFARPGVPVLPIVTGQRLVHDAMHDRLQERELAAIRGDRIRDRRQELLRPQRRHHVRINRNYHIMADEIVGRGAANAGLTWQFCRPPIDVLDYEMDVRGVRTEIVLP